MRTPYQNLTESFPNLKPAFYHLKANDQNFQQLLKQYKELDSLVHQVDHQQQSMHDLELEKIKKQRVALKDTLYNLMLECQQQLE